MELKDTCGLMCSDDYTDRFLAEYYQVETRANKLLYMLEGLEEGKLDFTPRCPKQLLDKQASVMVDYLQILQQRAELENIKLD